LFFNNFLKNIRNRVKLTKYFSLTTKERYSQKPVLNKMEYNISTKNGFKHCQSDVAKLDGNNEVLLIIVGYKGSVNGYQNKYFRIAQKVNETYGNTVFIFANNEAKLF